jgi:hypothetical protein
VSNQDTDVETLGIEQLTELRQATKTLWSSRVAREHEKMHLWEILQRIDGLMKTTSEQDGNRD